MPRLPGLLYTSISLLAFGLLFYVLAVGGMFFGGASSPMDLGVYAVTFTCLAFGVATWLLRRVRLQKAAADAS